MSNGVEMTGAQRVAHHFGNTLSTKRIGPFGLTEARYQPGLRTGWHFHASSAFCAVLSGGYVERFRGHTLACPARTVVFRPAEIEHLDEIDSRGATCFFVEPAPSWQLDAFEGTFGTGAACTIARGSANWLLAQARDEMRHNDSATPLALDGIMHLLLAECVRSSQPSSVGCAPWLRRARDLLSDRFAHPPTLGELARECGVHPAYLATAFRRAFRSTVGEYVRSLRVEAAERMLARSGRSLAQVALDAGFADQSHLTRVFRRATGLTPKEYRTLRMTS
jgi:AraC family transcriptional regulator